VDRVWRWAAIGAALVGVGLMVAVGQRDDAPVSDPAAEQPPGATIECSAPARIVRGPTEDYCAVQRSGKSVRHGPAVEWYDASRHHRRASGRYRNGVRDGLWIGWHASGARESEQRFVEGTAQGIFQRWFPNGVLAIEGEYVDGEKHGSWTEYFDNGRRAESGEYWTGVRQGSWTRWYPNGLKRSVRTYTAGDVDGFKEWNESGDLIDQTPTAAR